MKKITLLITVVLFSLGSAWADDWTETFDDEHSTSYESTSITLSGRTWGRSDAGNFSYCNTTMGSYGFTINDDKANGHILTPALNTCGTVSFDYAYKSGNSSNVFLLQVSTNGTDFETKDTHTLGSVSEENWINYSFDVNSAESVLYIRILSDNQNAHLFIDNFTVTSYTAGGPATPTISNFRPTDGTEILVGTSFNISAIVSTTEGSIDSVLFASGTSSTDLTDTVSMISAGVQDSFYLPMNIGDAGTYYGQVIAYGSNGTQKMSSINSVVALAPEVTTLPYAEDFAGGFGQCITYNVSGETKYWEISSELAQMNGYNSGDSEEDWLILPGINMNDYINESMSFESEWAYGSDDADNYIKLVYSTDYSGLGDPSSASWTELSYTKPSSANSSVSSGNIDLSAIAGDNVYIAFQYHYNSGNYRRWAIDNISISGQDASSTAPHITAITPVDNHTLTVGDSLTFTATVSIPSGTVDSVLLFFGESADNMTNRVALVYNSSLSCWMMKSKTTSTGTMWYKFVAYGNEKADTSAVQTVVVECGNVSAPTATAASNIESTSFTANWDAVTGADHYLLSVWKEEGSPEVVYASSEFDDGVSPFPNDWTNNTKVYTITAGNEGTKGLKLGSSSAAGEVTSPTFSTTEDFSVVFYGQEYDSDEQSITVSYGSQSETISTLSSTWTEYVLNFTAESGDNSVSFSAKRANLDEVTIKSGGYAITYILQNENVSPNSKSVTGLEAATDYKYSVVAVDQYGCESVASNEITATTGTATGIDKLTTENAKVYANDGAIIVKFDGIQDVTVYDIAGRVVTEKMVDSYATISVKSGIYLVRVNDKVSKVAVR